MRGKHLRRLLPDLTYAEAAHEPRKSCVLALFDGGNKILRGFFTHALKVCDRLRLKIIKVRCGIHKGVVYKAFAHGNAKPFDVHRLARGKVRDIAQTLRRALRTCAAQGDAVLVTHDG